MNKYLPDLPKISQEVVATGLALILVSFLIAKIPALKRLVKEYEI